LAWGRAGLAVHGSRGSALRSCPSASASPSPGSGLKSRDHDLISVQKRTRAAGWFCGRSAPALLRHLGGIRYVELLHTAAACSCGIRARIHARICARRRRAGRSAGLCLIGRAWVGRARRSGTTVFCSSARDLDLVADEHA